MMEKKIWKSILVHQKLSFKIWKFILYFINISIIDFNVLFDGKFIVILKGFSSVVIFFIPTDNAYIFLKSLPHNPKKNMNWNFNYQFNDTVCRLCVSFMTSCGTHSRHFMTDLFFTYSEYLKESHIESLYHTKKSMRQRLKESH